MAGADAGYTGVVYSDVDAGYTSAEGYTGVVRSRVASGYTGSTSASVTTSGRAGRTGRSAPTSPQTWQEADSGSRVRSPYDATIVERGREPGSSAPLDYRESSPPVDPGAARLAAEEELAPVPPRDFGSDDAESPTVEAEPDRLENDRTALLDAFVRSLFSVQDQLRLSPQPEPNRALESARDLLAGGVKPSPIGPPPGTELLGPLADYLSGQISEVLAETKPDTLGTAYLQGILQGLADTLIRGYVGLGQQTRDPIGTSIRTATELLDAIRAHTQAGEGFWEAVNSVLNPAARLFSEASQANEIAGKALEAARQGNWSEAVGLAREAGQRAVGGGPLCQHE
jgi:hypothetical protein